MRRRSVRNFQNKVVPEDVVAQLLAAANNAPSGGNIQPISIIVVQDGENRKRLAGLVGEQPWVKNAPLSMIFCLDFQRVKRWAAMNATEFKGEQALTHFLIAYADVMCAAQTVVILAESLGLGSVYVGSVNGTINDTREAFGIPQFVLPVMVLSLGYPKSIPQGIPKFTPDVIVHYERYQERNDAEVTQAFQAKYGDFGKSGAYLEKAFVETVEADRQGGDGWMEWALEEMQKLEIRNNAQFLFNLRYPAERMVQFNRHLLDSMRKAGFSWDVNPTVEKEV
jgi:FMN reductase [NAD(P)H]